MSYPPPPGLKATQPPSSSSTTQPHASLPPRPPPPAGPRPTFKPVFNPTSSVPSGAPASRGYGSSDGGISSTNGYTGFTGFQPRSVAANNQSFRTHNPVVSAAPTPPSGFLAPTTYTNANFQQPSYQQPPTASYYQQPSYEESYPKPVLPQIRNPFPLPGQGPGGRGQGGALGEPAVDPELEAQIAQWQSAYASKDENAGRGIGRTTNRFGGGGEGSSSATGANSGPLGGRPDISAPAMSNIDMSSAANTDSGIAAVVTGADGKQKTVVRSGGGQTWQDPTLLEWDPAHFRLFVGNLAGEVTDDSLLKAFAKYPSCHKARVIRDKRTTKSKGYGEFDTCQGAPLSY